MRIRHINRASRPRGGPGWTSTASTGPLAKRAITRARTLPSCASSASNREVINPTKGSDRIPKVFAIGDRQHFAYHRNSPRGAS